ncbi:MAG: SDR family NAD(P)-dependent oxidoreductase [Flavobacteriia bacterium]|jgi:3-oxoacyl-[acyl-carrier protein] reductase|nr:SDR family oxidoreductase [Cryomorphaceae bacterium]
MRTYLFIGASSAMAQTACDRLTGQGHRVIGISRNEIEGYSERWMVNEYNTEELPEIHEHLDGLVYFPGTINLKPFHRYKHEEVMNDLNVNVIGAFQSVQKYLPNLKQGTNPSVVLFSSVAATTGMTFHTSIAMAKGAIEGLTRSLAAEFAPTIRVNAIAPSLTNTALSEKFLSTPEKMEASAQRNPMKKVGTTEDLSNSIEFLLSEKSAWVTGQILHVDGGMGALRV